MRADKDFKTYEQALTIVQRFGEMAEAEHEKGKHKEANYNLAHATFVGVKHLLFMAADAAVDRAEARELAARNHLAIVELLSLTLAGLGGDDSIDETADAVSSSGPRRAMNGNGMPVKVKTSAGKTESSATMPSGRAARTSAPSKKSGKREHRR
jgi:hypothetical protein